MDGDLAAKDGGGTADGEAWRAEGGRDGVEVRVAGGVLGLGVHVRRDKVIPMAVVLCGVGTKGPRLIDME